MKERAKTILEAAQQVFGNHGFYRAKVQDIADEAGIGKGTVYEYFDSKEDLFYQMVRYSLSLYTQRVRAAMARGSCLDRLQGYIASNKRIVSKGSALVNMLWSSGPIGENELLRERIVALLFRTKQELVDMIAEALALGQSEGTIGGDIDTALTAEMFLHMTMGYCQSLARTRREETEGVLLDLFLRGAGARQ